MQALFSPNGGIADRMIVSVDATQVRADLQSFSFTLQALADAIKTSALRGRVYRVVIDESQTHGAQARIHDELELTPNVEVRLCKSPAGGIDHGKFAIIDSSKLLEGSWNFTNSAEHRNFEHQIETLLTDPGGPELITAFQAFFETVWASGVKEPKRHRKLRRVRRRICSFLLRDF